jgi:translocator protein
MPPMISSRINDRQSNTANENNMRKFPLQQFLGLAGWLALSFTAAALGAVASREAPAFYAQLTLPDWAPPAWLFGPVWTFLYLLMGVAAWLVWRTRGWAGARLALVLFLVQLGVNALWSWLFFAWRLGAAALVDSALLWLLVAATMLAFWRIRPLATVLLFPYLGWVGFATALTYAIWRFNPGLLG